MLGYGTFYAIECYQRELADPKDQSQQALFDTGIAVGELARQRFPRGRLAEEHCGYYPPASLETDPLSRRCLVMSGSNAKSCDSGRGNDSPGFKYHWESFKHYFIPKQAA